MTINKLKILFLVDSFKLNSMLIIKECDRSEHMGNYVYKRFAWLFNWLKNFRVGVLWNFFLNSAEYIEFLREVKQRIYKSQYEAMKSVNKELIDLYWNLEKRL